MLYFWKNFRKSKSFLVTYLALELVLLGLLSLLCFTLEIGNIISFDAAPWPLIFPAILIGIKLPTMMHNAVHGNFSNYNFSIGLLSAQLILVSFGIVCINHTFHHAFPDTDKDPHSPVNKSFFLYLLTCLHSGVDVVRDGYYQFHGKTSQTQNLFKLAVILHFLGIPVRLLAWYSVLGPELMTYFFLPAFLSFIITFAHVNFITHQIDEDGKSITVNKDSNIWYNFVNFVADGIYFHKNHHANPKLYNPKLKGAE